MKKLSLIAAFTLVFALLALTACAPLNADSAKKILEDNGYEVRFLENEYAETCFRDDVKISAVLTATKEDEGILIAWFINEDDAKKAESELKELMRDEYEAEVYRDDKIVAWGSKETIKLIK